MDKCAVYTGSKNIYEDMLVCSKSLIANSDVNKIYFLIEDDIFPFETPDDIIEPINVSDQEYFNFWGPNMKTKFTYFAMMRAALALRILNKVWGLRNPFCRNIIAPRYITTNTAMVMDMSRFVSDILFMRAFNPPVVFDISHSSVHVQLRLAAPFGARSFLKSISVFSLTAGALRTTRRITTTALYAERASDLTSNL